MRTGSEGWRGFLNGCIYYVVYTHRRRILVTFMGLSIRDAATERLVRALAKRKGVGLTEAVRLAVGTELQRLDSEPPLRDRIATIRRSIVARGRTGKRSDKAFFDDLSGER